MAAVRSSLLAASLILGCTPQPGERQPPPLPEGAELLMEVDGLSIYNVEPGEICEGDLRRIVEHWHHLVDYLGVTSPKARLVLYDYQTQNDASRCRDARRTDDPVRQRVSLDRRPLA